MLQSAFSEGQDPAARDFGEAAPPILTSMVVGA